MVELIEILESLTIPFEASSQIDPGWPWYGHEDYSVATYTRNDVTRTIGADHLYFDGPGDAMKAWAI